MKKPDRSIDILRRRSHLCARFTAMGSPCEFLIDTDVEAEAEKLSAVISAEAWRIEDKFSRYIPGNLVDRINGGQAVEVDEETAKLLDFSQTLYEMSAGRFDITSGVLREAWNFDGSENVPAPARVKKLVKRIGWNKVSWQSPRLQLPAGMQIDLGGVAKEYAVDRAALLAAEATESACLVNFGGDLLATGAPRDSEGWQVGIDATDRLAVVGETLIRLRNGGLATSGDARRFLLKDGVRYSHILDPTTGWPITGAPQSITVAADSCTQAGMLATLAMLKGAAAESFLEGQAVQFWING